MELPKTALITGITGCLGSAVARRLIALGVKTYGIVRPGSRAPVSLANGAHLMECHQFSCDELERVLNVAQPETVIHLAAAGVSAGGRDVSTLLKANVDMTVNLLRAAERAGRPIIVHAGSCFEYADCGDEDIDEQSPIHPFSLYGATKSASVQLAIGLARELELRLVVLRLFGIYGEGEASQRLVPTLIRNLAEWRPTPLSHGAQVRDLMLVDDMAAAYIAALENFDSLENESVYNVCTGQGHTVRQIGELIADQMQRPQSLLQWSALPARQGEPARIVGDGTRFAEATGWQPAHDLQAGIRRTIQALIEPASTLRRAA